MGTMAWPSLHIVNLERALDDLEHLVDAPPHDQPDEISRAMARFLVVRTCGFIEQVIEESCRAYMISKATPAVARFGSSWLGRGMNPSPERMIALVNRFDTVWGTELEDLLKADDEFLARELAFLVDRRNKIAHGLNEGIGARKALDLKSAAVSVTDWFILRFNPS